MQGSRSQNMGGELRATAGSHRKAGRLLLFYFTIKQLTVEKAGSRLPQIGAWV